MSCIEFLSLSSLEVEKDEVTTNSGPAVFCGLGLTFGLLGVAAGTFFFVKGRLYAS